MTILAATLIIQFVVIAGTHVKFATHCCIRTVDKRVFITQMSVSKAACFVHVFGVSQSIRNSGCVDRHICVYTYIETEVVKHAHAV